MQSPGHMVDTPVGIFLKVSQPMGQTQADAEYNDYF